MEASINHADRPNKLATFYLLACHVLPAVRRLQLHLGRQEAGLQPTAPGQAPGPMQRDGQLKVCYVADLLLDTCQRIPP